MEMNLMLVFQKSLQVTSLKEESEPLPLKAVTNSIASISSY